MENAIIVHGKPTRERYENPAEPKPHVANWLQWLGGQLRRAGVASVAVPAMPLPYFPVYKDWLHTFETTVESVGPITENTILVGHSAGAEFLLRYLSERRDRRVGKLVLVAPYRDYAGKYGDFSDFEVDPELAERIGEIIIVNSLDDDPPIQDRTAELRRRFPLATYLEFEHHGHFRIGHNMTGPEFPQLLEAILQ